MRDYVRQSKTLILTDNRLGKETLKVPLNCNLRDVYCALIDKINFNSPGAVFIRFYPWFIISVVVLFRVVLTASKIRSLVRFSDTPDNFSSLNYSQVYFDLYTYKNHIGSWYALELKLYSAFGGFRSELFNAKYAKCANIKKNVLIRYG